MVDFLCNTCNRHSDKTGERFFHIVIPLFIGIIGFVIATLTMNLAARYLALYVRYLISPIDMHLTIHSFLMAQSLTGYICFLTWMSNTFVHSPSKRAVALAFVNAFSQLGNVGSSYVLRIIFDILVTVILMSRYVWQTSWGPTYIRSYAICISTSGLGIVMCLIFRQVLANQNKHLEQHESSPVRPRFLL